MEIAEFLLARIAEDEAKADHWERQDAAVGYIADVCPEVYEERPWLRLRQECEAKRALLYLHEAERHDTSPRALTVCFSCAGGGGFNADWPCRTVRVMAAVYADHPDYDESWRP